MTDPLLAALTSTDLIHDATLVTSHPTGRRPCSQDEAQRIAEVVRGELPEPDTTDCGWSTWLIGGHHRVLLDPNGGVAVTGPGPVDPRRCALALLAAAEREARDA